MQHQFTQNSRKDFVLVLQLARDDFGDSNECVEKLIVNVNLALVLCQISFPVRMVKDALILGREIQSVLSTLEHEVTAFRSVACSS